MFDVDSRSREVKNSFHWELPRLLYSVHSTDVGIVASEFNAQLGNLAKTEKHIGGRFPVEVDRTDNRNHLIQVCCSCSFVIKTTSARPAPLLGFTVLGSDRSHGQRSPVALINRKLSVILVHASGLRSLFGPSSLFRTQSAVTPTQKLLVRHS